MPPDLAEWVAKAEADWATARREFRVRRQVNFDAVCFHAQQCVEKYLKARLILAHIHFPKTHDLVALLALVQRWNRSGSRGKTSSPSSPTLPWPSAIPANPPNAPTLPMQ